MLLTAYISNRKLRWLMLIVTVLGVFQLLEHSLNATGGTLRFDRSLVIEGDYYRLITAHLVHLNWTHFYMNGLGLIICCLLLDGTATGLTLTLLLAITSISAGLWFSPQVQWYAGYSGVLYGQIMYALLAGIIKEGRRVRSTAGPSSAPRLGVLVIGVIALMFKVIDGVWPLMSSSSGGNMSEVLIGAPVLHEAHLAGAIAGLIAFGLLRLQKSPQT